MRNDVFEALLYGSGVTSHGCWSKLDDWDKRAIERFGQMIVRECAEIVQEGRWMVPPSQHQLARSIKQHFGVK